MRLDSFDGELSCVLLVEVEDVCLGEREDRRDGERGCEALWGMEGG